MGLVHLSEYVELCLSPCLGTFSAIISLTPYCLLRPLLWILEICLLFTVSETLSMFPCLCSLLFRTENFLCCILRSQTLSSLISAALGYLSGKFVKFSYCAFPFYDFHLILPYNLYFSPEISFFFICFKTTLIDYSRIFRMAALKSGQIILTSDTPSCQRLLVIFPH